MHPTQQTPTKTSDQKIFIVLTEPEQQRYQVHQQVGQRPFNNKWQHQNLVFTAAASPA